VVRLGCFRFSILTTDDKNIQRASALERKVAPSGRKSEVVFYWLWHKRYVGSTIYNGYLADAPG
jgi:hypothetical protein